MKQKIIFFLLFFSIHGIGFTQNNILNISQTGNSITTTFTLPNYSIKDTSLLVPYGVSEIFNYIDIGNFGIVDSAGLPMLPQFTFDLHVPSNALNFQINIGSAQTSTVNINKKIMPFQEDIDKENPVFTFSKNTAYYNSSGGFCSSYVQLNESFIVFGEQGLSVTIFPFIYNPSQNKLTVLSNVVFTVSYTLSPQLKDYYYTEAKDNYLHSLFENYGNTLKSTTSELYLMITAPEYESTLTYFANYKRNIGYQVKVVTTNTTGTSVSAIKNYIQNQYNNTSTRPTYVLLVGDVDKIPAYAGDPLSADNNIDNPITDLGYSLLDGNDNLADVFLGRFSVSKLQELINIINKTIFMEMNMHRFIKKAKFLAGDDDSWKSAFMRSEFERGHNYVIPYSFNPLGYNCQKLYQPNHANAKNALSDNPLFFVYSGHGGFTSLAGHTFGINADTIASATNTIFPLVFAFACKTGNFAYENVCVGESFIRLKDKGAIAYFGCSVKSQTNSDVAIEKKIFGDAFKTDEQNLSAIINVGMRRFTYVTGIRKKIKDRYLKAYNLLGDPSFDTKGIGCRQNFVFNNPEVFKSGAEITYRANNSIQNSNNFVVENGANVKLLARNSVRLTSGFKVEAGANFKAEIVPCNNGVILKSFAEDDNEEVITNIENTIEPEIDIIINPALFSIFPNPTTDDFSLAYTLENNSFVQIELYNMNGVYIKEFLQIAEQEAGVYYHNFSLSGLPPGMYVVVFKSNSKTISTKIIKH